VTGCVCECVYVSVCVRACYEEQGVTGCVCECVYVSVCVRACVRATRNKV